MQHYRDLKVWQLGVEISLATYQLTNQFPADERFGLTSQMRRASISIPSNLAERHARSSTKDFLRFLAIARGSLAELETQATIAERLGYVDSNQLAPVVDMLDEEGRMLAGLRKSLEAKL